MSALDPAISDLFLLPERQPLYQAMCAVYRQSGGRGIPPPRFLIYLLGLLYPRENQEWRDPARATISAVQQVLDLLLEEQEDVARLAHAYPEREDAVFRRIIARLGAYQMYVEFALDALETLRAQEVPRRNLEVPDAGV